MITRTVNSTGAQESSGKGVSGGELILSPACEEAFCRLITRRTGIVLHDHLLPNLRETIRQGCGRFGFAACEQYLQFLEASHGLTPQLEFLIAGVTVGESYFFRDSEQIELLRTSLLPDMIAAKRASGDLSLRIWSAGCSMGQEIYTIALLLRELIPDMDSWRLHLLGTDINTEMVGKAILGRYSEWSFRATPSEIRERWFARVGTEYGLRPEVRRMVKFSYLNLTEDIFPSILSETNALDLILCRNVFIYLDREVIRRVMEQFSECLTEQGVLLLGASDPVEIGSAALEWKQTGQTASFHKGAQENAPVPEYQTRTVLPATGTAVLRPREADMAPAPGVAPVQGVKPTDGERAAIGMLGRNDWAGGLAIVEDLCRQGEDGGMLQQMRAQALANLGRIDEAQEACLRSLQFDPENKHVYLVQALIMGEANREREAEESLRKALYLDRSFLEAHYELGMLQVRTGRMASGIKSLENALKLALAGSPERALHNAGGMTFQRFAQVLQSEIEIYRNGNSATALKLASRKKK